METLDYNPDGEQVRSVPDLFYEHLAERVAAILRERQTDDAERRAEPWPEWMSAETAARYLDVSVERVRKLQARGDVPFYQEGPGCRVFFRRSELDAWMESYQDGRAR